MNTIENLTTNVQTKLFSMPDAKTVLSVRASRSSGKWQAVKNSSWGEEHKKIFGDKEGFVICVKNSNREMVAIASVSGYFGQEQKQVAANAKLIEAAPALLEALEKFTMLNENHYRDIAGLIQYAKNVFEKLS